MQQAMEMEQEAQEQTALAASQIFAEQLVRFLVPQRPSLDSDVDAGVVECSAFGRLSRRHGKPSKRLHKPRRSRWQ